MTQTPCARCIREIVIKRSRFIALAAPAASRAAALECVAAARAEHPQARHHCWAWVGGNSAACDDDGEPAGTAGRPLRNVIGHKGLVDVVVVVTRYFGGIKLGASGLVRAYAGAAEAVLAEVPRRVIPPLQRRVLHMGFADEQPLRHWLSGVEGAVLESLDYGEGVSAVVTLPEAVLEAFDEWCSALGIHCQSTRDESCIESSARR